MMGRFWKGRLIKSIIFKRPEAGNITSIPKLLLRFLKEIFSKSPVTGGVSRG